MKSIRYKLQLILICTSVLAFSQKDTAKNRIVAADSITVFDGSKTIVCRHNLYIYEDKDQKKIHSIAATNFQNQFHRLSEEDTLKKGHTYWLKFTLKNNFNAYQQLDRYYFTAKNISKYIYLYLESPSNSNEFVEIVGGELLSDQKRTAPNGFFWFLSDVNMKLPLTNAKYLTYYVKIKCLYDYAFIKEGYHFDVIKFGLIKQSNKHFGYMVLVYVGFLVMMFIYSLGLYSFIQEASFLYYALFCLSMLIYNATTYSITRIIFSSCFPNHPAYELLLRLSIYVALISFLLFIISYLDLKKELLLWYHIFKGLIIVLLGFLLFECYLIYTDGDFPYSWKEHLLHRIFYILTPVNILVLIFLIPLWKLKTKRKYFLFLGILTLTIGIVYLIYLMFTNNGVITREAYAPMLAFSALEMVFFALGLAYRIKENEAEKGKTLLYLQQVENEKQIIALEKKNLEEISEIKTEFYTNVTHNFRTPLTIIEGMAELIKSKKYTQERLSIQRNTKKLLQMVNQILDLSKLESSEMTPNLQQSDIVIFLKNEVKTYIAFATSQDIDLQIQCSSSSIEMDFDPLIIRQILANLLSNALKFILKDGEIHVRLKKIEKETQLLLEVEDTGKGIPEDQLSKIFDRYYQVDDSAEYSTLGTGIGLAHTKELVNLIDGKISVTSELNTGSIFRIILPITQKANKITIEEISSIYIENNADSELTQASSIENFDLPLLLIVEDNEDVIQYLIRCLQDEYRILTALNGKEGIQKALKHIPDLIISDVMMPEVDGFNLTQRLKKDERTSHIPIILLTAKADQKGKIEGLQSGADAYIYKPFDREEMLVRLEKLLELRKKLQRYYAAPEQLKLNTKKGLSLDEQFLKNVQEKINQHLDDADYKVEQLAKDIHLSRAQLFRKIKALTGESVSGYIRLIRLTYAKKLLESSSFTISEIAYKAGFSTPAYFSKRFSKFFGFSPSKMRE